MTIRQLLLKKLYPLIMKLSNSSEKKGKILINLHKTEPPTSFYTLNAISNKGEEISFESLKGKKILLVNTASNCAYTSQFDELQDLQEKYSNKLVVLGFPANDFKDQEKGNDEAIAQFCKLNFGVTFPLMKKSVVIKSENQNAVFEWLSNPEKNGWNSHQPDWNFSKYLVNEHGLLTHYFGPSVSPLGKEVIASLE